MRTRWNSIADACVRSTVRGSKRLRTAFKRRLFKGGSKALVAAAALTALLAAGPGGLYYPPTPVHPVVDHYFGHAVIDPYRWLEDGNATPVQAWVGRQTALTLGFLHTEPSYPIYAQRVAALSHTSTARFALRMAGGRYVYLRQTPPQLQAQLVVRDGIHGAERVLFDPQTAPRPRWEAAVDRDDRAVVRWREGCVHDATRRRRRRNDSRCRDGDGYGAQRYDRERGRRNVACCAAMGRRWARAPAHPVATHGRRRTGEFAH